MRSFAPSVLPLPLEIFYFIFYFFEIFTFASFFHLYDLLYPRTFTFGELLNFIFIFFRIIGFYTILFLLHIPNVPSLICGHSTMDLTYCYRCWGNDKSRYKYRYFINYGIVIAIFRRSVLKVNDRKIPM